VSEVCCVCSSPKVTYRNYREQSFCWNCANPVPRPRWRIYIEPRDAWVGAYIAKDAVYVCPLPFVVIRRWRRP
jgi:hypothetical protein